MSKEIPRDLDMQGPEGWYCDRGTQEGHKAEEGAIGCLQESGKFSQRERHLNWGLEGYVGVY